MFSMKTDRLIIREFSLDDTDFIITLLNSPGWLRFIGDRQVHTKADAEFYLLHGPLKSYAEKGFGLYLMQRKEDMVPVGMCGILKRDTLPDVDIGFALLPEFEGQGYAFEAAQVVLEDAKNRLGFARILAITATDNDASGKLLLKLGFSFERELKLPDDEETLRLYSMNA